MTASAESGHATAELCVDPDTDADCVKIRATAFWQESSKNGGVRHCCCANLFGVHALVGQYGFSAIGQADLVKKVP